MGWTAAVLNVQCSALVADVTHASIHTATPDGTGSNDSGITHAAISWGAPSNGTVTGTFSFTGITVDATHIGFWESATWRGAQECAFELTVAADVNFTITYQLEEADA